jgi:diguanylate cyclase (GGDEF)-like protein
VRVATAIMPLKAMLRLPGDRMAAQHWAQSPLRLTLPFILLAICFSALCAWILLDARRATEERAAEVATSLSRSIKSDIARSVEAMDLSLEGAAAALTLPGFDALNPELQRHVVFDYSSTAPHLASMLVVDETGRITLDSRRPDPSSQNLSDRDFFMVHEAGDSVGLFVSQPFVSRVDGALAGEVLVAFSRRRSHPDGSFAGIVVGALPQSYLQAVFKNVVLGPNGTMTLVHVDGTVLSRWPFRQDFIGKNIKQAGLFSAFGRARSGRYESVAVSDGIKRLFVYSQIEDLPLIIVVGQSLDDIFAPWRRQAIAIAVLVILLCAVTVFLAAILNRELKRRSAAERKLTLLATTDGLTGLANRRHFNRALAYEWRRAMRGGTPLSLLMIDADEFKLYNDRHGHQAGDRLLRTFATSIAANLMRPTDLGVRYGGDEFAVLLPDTALGDAASLAERIREDLVARCGADDIQRGHGRLSVGVACLIPGKQTRYPDLIAAADSALYEAKRLGRNRIALAETSSGDLAPGAEPTQALTQL